MSVCSSYSRMVKLNKKKKTITSKKMIRVKYAYMFLFTWKFFTHVEGERDGTKGSFMIF